MRKLHVCWGCVYEKLNQNEVGAQTGDRWRIRVQEDTGRD